MRAEGRQDVKGAPLGYGST